MRAVMTSIYRVVLTVELPHASNTDKAYEELVHANDVQVDEATLVVTEQLIARSQAEAVNKAINVTEAQLKCGDIRPETVDSKTVEVI